MYFVGSGGCYWCCLLCYYDDLSIEVVVLWCDVGWYGCFGVVWIEEFGYLVLLGLYWYLGYWGVFVYLLFEVILYLGVLLVCVLLFYYWRRRNMSCDFRSIGDYFGNLGIVGLGVLGFVLMFSDFGFMLGGL